MTATMVHAGSLQHLAGRVAGAAYSRAGRPKHISAAYGAAHRSTGTRYQHGALQSPLACAVATLVGADHLTPWPALVEAHALVIQHRIREVTTPALRDRRADLEQQEFALRAEIDRARYVGESLRDLRARMADMAVELLAIEGELDERSSGAK
jgi:uncharacterized protein YhdP